MSPTRSSFCVASGKVRNGSRSRPRPFFARGFLAPSPRYAWSEFFQWIFSSDAASFEERKSCDSWKFCGYDAHCALWAIRSRTITRSGRILPDVVQTVRWKPESSGTRPSTRRTIPGIFARNLGPRRNCRQIGITRFARSSIVRKLRFRHVIENDFAFGTRSVTCTAARINAGVGFAVSSTDPHRPAFSMQLQIQASSLAIEIQSPKVPITYPAKKKFL